MKPYTLLLLGDSLIDHGNWSLLLPDYRSIVRGVSGETAAELRRRVPTELADCHADGVVIMTGTNDLFVGTAANPAADVARIVAMIQQALPAAVVILTALPPFDLPGLTARVTAINAALGNLAERTGCRYCDLAHAFSGNGEALFSFDGVHLNKAGYRVWADALLPLLDGLAFADK